MIIGRKNLSAIGTLVERCTNYTMLLHLPDGYTPELVRDALAAKIKTLPYSLRGSLTWDQGPEMNRWEQLCIDADIDIYFCDPHSPWQRATNENTNGLLRQYFPKGTDLLIHTAEDLDRVAAELNDRPRKRLGFQKPIELIGPLMLRDRPNAPSANRYRWVAASLPADFTTAFGESTLRCSSSSSYRPADSPSNSAGTRPAEPTRFGSSETGLTL